MTNILSTRGGSRREDQLAKQLIERNRGTIEKLADHLSSGAYSASKAPRPAAEPATDGKIIHVLGGKGEAEPARPYVRISPNDRVVLADHATGRQLEFLGQIRRRDGIRSFALATKANGFFSELGAATAAALAPLDGMALAPGDGEARLAADIRERLGMSEP